MYKNVVCACTSVIFKVKTCSLHISANVISGECRRQAESESTTYANFLLFFSQNQVWHGI